MRCLLLLACATLAGAASAQNSVIFTGRFPFVSLDAPNERPGGAMTQLSEFDISIVTPSPAGAVARSWTTTTAHSAAWGDPHNDGNYTRFSGWKTYFERFNFAGPFVKFADRASGDPKKVYFTIRDDRVGKRFEVFTANGTNPVQIKTGDFFRFLPNGNVEFFITQALILKAKGPANGSEEPGADCMFQDALGNLYWSPGEGGHWVSGNTGTPRFFNDGSVIMLNYTDIVYDANGNVLDVTPDSAFAVFGEVQRGPNGEPHIRDMWANAGARDFNGNPMTITANMVGLQMDPNGGTILSSIDGPGGGPVPVPNFIFTTDSGTAAFTLVSSAINPNNGQPGSIAVINGVRWGDDLVAGTGAWSGTQLDMGNFQPTCMGFAIIDTPPSELFIADMPNHGAVLQTDPTIDFDYWAGSVPAVITMVIGAGPIGGGQVTPSVDLTGFLGPDSYGTLFVLQNFITAVPIGPTNAGGYGNLPLANPMDPALTGLALVSHGVKLSPFGPGFAVSNPVMMQFK